MAFIERTMLPRLIFLGLILLVSSHGAVGQQIGFSLRKDSEQFITHSGRTKVGPWDIAPKKRRGLFNSSLIKFDDQKQHAIIPRSGLYLVIAQLYLTSAKRNVRYGCHIKTSMSDRTLSALTSNHHVNDDISVSGVLQLTIGEKVFVVLDSGSSDVSINTNSSFSLRLQGQYGLTPSFLAHPVKDGIFKANQNVQIINWKASHKSMTSFSPAAGIFVPLASTNYVCNLNLILRNVHGLVTVTLQTNTSEGNNTNTILLAVSKNFKQRNEVTTVHISKVLSLKEDEVFWPIIRGINGSFVVSKETTYSCVTAGDDKHAVTLNIEEPTKVTFRTRSWFKMNSWKEKQMSNNDFTHIEGEIFINSKETLAFVSLALSVKANQNDFMQIAIVPGGVASTVDMSKGLVKSLNLKQSSYETVSFTGAIKVPRSTSLSVFLVSREGVTLTIENAELKILVQESAMSAVLAPFMNHSVYLEPNTRQMWKQMHIDEKSLGEPFGLDDSQWTVVNNTFSPVETGVYYISVVMTVDQMNFTGTSYDVFDGKLVRDSEKGANDLQYVSQGLRRGLSTINIAGIYFLKSSDKIAVRFRCESCQVLTSSGFSAVWLAKMFKVEGFSTKLKANKPWPRSKEKIKLDGWESQNPNFIQTSSFHASSGEYQATRDGVFLVAATILVANVSAETTLKLHINHGVKPYTEEFTRLCIDGIQHEERTLTIMLPFLVKRGQLVSLSIFASFPYHVSPNDFKSRMVIRKQSTFAIFELSDSNSALPSGFTVLKQESYLPLGIPSDLKNWVVDPLRGSFIYPDKSVFDFKETQGIIFIRKSGVMLLNVIVNAEKFIEPTNCDLLVKINEKEQTKVLVSKSTQIRDQNNPSNKNKNSPLKISAVFVVKAEDKITVLVKTTERGGFYHIPETVMSAIFLPDVPKKPALMLGIRDSQLIGRNKTTKIYRFVLKNSCFGCYQQNILYQEKQGYFKMPFAGTYIISISLKAQTKSQNGHAKCGILELEKNRFITSKLLRDDHFAISETLDITDASKLSFSCLNDDTVTFSERGYVSITLLQYHRALPAVSVPETRQLSSGPQSELSYTVKNPGHYLIAINNGNKSLGNFKLLHDRDEIIDFVAATRSKGSSLYVAALLKPLSNIALQWVGETSDFNENSTKLYMLNREDRGVSLSLKRNFIVSPSNKSSTLVTGWQKDGIVDFAIGQEFDLKRGLFIAKQPSEYLITVVGNFVAATKRRRSIFLAIDDSLEKESFAVPVCSTQKQQRCSTSLTTTLKLQKWQSFGLHISPANVNDTITVMAGTRLSVLLLDSSIPKYDDPGPNFVSQPQPVYVNKSTIFQWTCDAIGSKEITYTWKWVNRETKNETTAKKGNTLKIYGRPEESGYYYCTANMNGTIHNSRLATLDISDTDECKLNVSEVGLLCHKNATCFNTIGSYLCECNDGFSGNGFKECRDINECSVNTTCHRDALCENTVGSHVCTCKEGYSGNGKHCEDINECLGPNDCHKDSICLNTKGSYECVCKQGFSGDGKKCTNIKECFNEIYPCDKHADCYDTIGSFTCKCMKGWTGNGTICTDIDECQFTNCTGNATCHNMPGSYRCKCNRGYKGDGFVRCISLGCTPPPECTGEFKAAWWARSPYLANSSNDEPLGLFKDLLTQVIISCCANCSVLSFVGPYNGSLDVEEAMEGNQTVDFGCPLYGSPEQTLFRGLPFMPVVESPGIAFFIKDKPKEGNALVSSLGSSWPILAITFLLACLSGVIIWFLDTVRNPTEFPNSFIRGSWEGFWWAFITMTTVGYGDKAPRSFGARLFGIVWILVGLVIISTFTATITTMLTTSSLSDETKLYGTKVGVLHNSEEYRLGVKRNAETKAYGSVAEIVQKVDEEEVQGILLDTYIAGEFQDQLGKLRLQQVIDYTFSYGVVLSRDGLALRKCFSHFLESKQSQIYATISKVIKPLKTTGQQNLASKKSANIFDAESVYFKWIVFTGLSIFAFLFLIGVIWECVNMRNRKKRYDLAETSEPKESELLEWKVQWESGKVSHFHRNIFKNDISDLKQQIKDFAENWIGKLEELEKRQAKEVNNFKKHESKNNKKNHDKHHDEKHKKLFNFFNHSAKETNGHIHDSEAAL